MSANAEAIFKKMQDSLESRNEAVLKEYAEIKKNNIWLSEDEFSHYKFLNSLANEFFKSNSFNYDLDKEGFLSFAENVGNNHFLGLFVNLNPNIDMNLCCGESFTYSGQGYQIIEQKLLNKKVILLSLLNDEGRPMISKAIISFYLFKTEKNNDARETSFNKIFAPLGPLSQKLNEKAQGFFALVDQKLDFEGIKSFKNIKEEICEEWVGKTKAHNARIRADLMSLKGYDLENK